VSSAAINFVLMLTERDSTIPDAVEVYNRIKDTSDSLDHIAFKDVGADPAMLVKLTDAIHEDGRLAVLEIADMSDRGQEEGMRLALTLGVDKVVGRWSERSADLLGAAAGSPEYWPFLGCLDSNPLMLRSSPDELAAMAAELSSTEGVHGVVLMPYRQQTYDPSVLLERTSLAAAVPLLVAGGVSGRAQIECIAQTGAWGFTIGSAVLSARQDDPVSVNRRIGEVLMLCREMSVRYATRRCGKGEPDETHLRKLQQHGHRR
jgi:hypothetical protein